MNLFLYLPASLYGRSTNSGYTERPTGYEGRPLLVEDVSYSSSDKCNYAMTDSFQAPWSTSDTGSAKLNSAALKSTVRSNRPKFPETFLHMVPLCGEAVSRSKFKTCSSAGSARIERK